MPRASSHPPELPRMKVSQVYPVWPTVWSARLAFLVGLLVVLLGASRSALAQGTGTTGLTITVNPVINRSSTPAGRPSGLKTNQVNRADCEADVTLQFSLSFQGPLSSANHLEVWAGASGDCSTKETRNGSNTATCWPVVAGTITAAATTRVDVRVRDLIGPINTNPKPTVYSKQEVAACSAQSTQGVANIGVYFLYLDAGSTATSSANAAMEVAMVGPDGPASVTAGEADRVIVVNWTPPTSSGSSRTGYKVYCAQVYCAPVGAASEVDAGTSTPEFETVCADGGFTEAGVDEDGGVIEPQPIDGGCTQVEVDSGATGDPTCPAPTINQECATVGESSQAKITENIVNGQCYSVAVAAVDKFGNAGKLSPASCVTPGPVADFFHNYRDAGGQAGGCAFGPAAGGSFVLGGLGTVVIALLRRRRRNSAP
jgi:hypothetical protein